MFTFNFWVTLTRTTLNDRMPLLPQLQKLSDARTNLDNNSMQITNLQFCFILIKALPESYSAIASTFSLPEHRLHLCHLLFKSGSLMRKVGMPDRPLLLTRSCLCTGMTTKIKSNVTTVTSLDISHLTAGRRSVMKRRKKRRKKRRQGCLVAVAVPPNLSMCIFKSCLLVLL